MEKFVSLADFLGVQDPLQLEKPAAPAPDPNLSVQDFCKAILASPQYRESLLRRVIMDELPPSVELMIWDRAHGKSVEKVEHTGKDGRPIETITEVRRVLVRANAEREQEESDSPSYTTH